MRQIVDFEAAALEAKKGMLVSFCGMSNVPYEVLDRAVRLHRKFQRDPYTYLCKWQEFQLSKGPSHDQNQ
jgi:hypothetical protein